MISGMCVNFKKTVLRLIEPRHIIKLGCFDQPASGVVAPAMVSTTQDSRRTSLFSGDRVSAMATDIMESTDLVVFSADQENWKPGKVEGLICARFVELSSVCEVYPRLSLVSAIQYLDSFSIT